MLQYVIDYGKGCLIRCFVVYGWASSSTMKHRKEKTEELFDAVQEELKLQPKGQVCGVLGDYNVDIETLEAACGGPT